MTSLFAVPATPLIRSRRPGLRVCVRALSNRVRHTEPVPSSLLVWLTQRPRRRRRLRRRTTIGLRKLSDRFRSTNATTDHSDRQNNKRNLHPMIYDKRRCCCHSVPFRALHVNPNPIPIIKYSIRWSIVVFHIKIFSSSKTRMIQILIFGS